LQKIKSIQLKRGAPVMPYSPKMHLRFLSQRKRKPIQQKTKTMPREKNP